MKLPKKGEIRKPTKTISGVTPIAVMVKPRPCAHGVCRYCPMLEVPQSYTPKSPPVIRAKMLNYSAYEQILSRLKAFKLMNHPTDKIELIVMGGTFLSYPLDYQYNFIKGCYDALNGRVSKTLETAKKLNEKAKHRCVALCIETRPDFASEEDIKRCLEFGATRVELGVQVLDDKIYKKINRGHTLKDVIDATARLKQAGFKVGYHMMPGLPGATMKKDLEMFKELFSNESFKPDQLKIYPCKPYNFEQTKSLLTEIFKIIPEYCRVMRVMREIPPEFLIAGTIRIDLRKDVEFDLRNSKSDIKEIRFREIGFAKSEEKEDDKISIKETEYSASKGTEYFLQAVNKNNILFGLLRLRINNNINNNFIKELKDCAIVREIHVYGKALALGKKSKSAGQHKGIGKMLMQCAEEIAKQNSIKKVAVISGVGVREYYRKLGYKLKGSYMIKRI